MKTIKRKPRKPSSAPITLAPDTAWDRGAMGAANRIGLVEEDAGQYNPETGKVENPNGVKRHRRVDMLEEWHGNYIKQNGRPFITTAQYNAADALQSAFARTMMGPGVDLAQERVDSSPKPDHAVTIQIDRISRFHRIARLVPTADQGIINWCVLMARTPIDYRMKDGSRPYNGRGYADGMRVLRDALERLARQMGN